MKVIGRLDPVCSGSALQLAGQAEIFGLESRAARQRAAGNQDDAFHRTLAEISGYPLLWRAIEIYAERDRRYGKA